MTFEEFAFKLGETKKIFRRNSRQLAYPQAQIGLRVFNCSDGFRNKLLRPELKVGNGMRPY